MNGAPAEGGAGRPAGASFRVATFNIRTGLGLDGRHAWPLRAGVCAAAISALDADVVGLQEVLGWQLRSLLRRLGAYAAVGSARDDGAGRGERCTVLYRPERLRLEWTATRWLSDTPDVPGSRSWGNPLPRIATLCRFRHVHTGITFGVADTHWDGASAASRERSAEALLGWLEPGLPWVVLGDLNATPEDAGVARLLGAGLRDALAGLPARGPGAATHHPWDGAVSGTRIDHVLVTDQWIVEEARIAAERPHGRLPSDHWPVTATLRLHA